MQRDFKWLGVIIILVAFGVNYHLEVLENFEGKEQVANEKGQLAEVKRKDAEIKKLKEKSRGDQKEIQELSQALKAASVLQKNANRQPQPQSARETMSRRAYDEEVRRQFFVSMYQVFFERYKFGEELRESVVDLLLKKSATTAGFSNKEYIAHHEVEGELKEVLGEGLYYTIS